MNPKYLKLSVLLFGLFAFSQLYAQRSGFPNYEKAFASYDTNHDKIIRFDEFRNKKRNSALDHDQDKLRKLFDKMDTNSSGFIDFQEFKTPIPKPSKNKKAKKV
ncbi:EF-hand domain-containing protein [Mariniflexile sp.]|uniref:EF-hand domain-containing protein n=1 Tax=Mariniflexile sp. TaxID=1979402 RepID=UPI004047C679